MRGRRSAPSLRHQPVRRLDIKDAATAPGTFDYRVRMAAQPFAIVKALGRFQRLIAIAFACRRKNDRLKYGSPKGPLIMGEIREIGRASCRERVCQYV